MLFIISMVWLEASADGSTRLYELEIHNIVGWAINPQLHGVIDCHSQEDRDTRAGS